MALPYAFDCVRLHVHCFLQDAYSRTNFKHPALSALIEKHLARMPARPRRQLPTTAATEAELDVSELAGLKKPDTGQNRVPVQGPAK